MMIHSAQIFKDIHKDKLIIIAGSGPSLLDYTHEDVKDHILICVNNSIVHFPQCDYFFAVDTIVTKSEAWKHLHKGNDLIFGDQFYIENIKIHKPGNYTILKRTEFGWMNPQAKNLMMGKDAVQSAVHLALIMGARAVVLIGVDLMLIQGKKYFHEDHISEQGDESLERSRIEWIKIMEANKEIPLFNCSQYGSMVGMSHLNLNEIKLLYKGKF